MKKGDVRGLSTVVTTLILVLLVIVAVAIVWGVVANILYSTSEDISIDQFSVQLSPVSITTLPSGNTQVLVKREGGDAELDTIYLYVSDGKNTEAVKVEGLKLGPFETVSHEIKPDDLKTVKAVKSVAVAPGIGSNRQPGNVQEAVNSDMGDSLIAYWPMDGNANDASGNGHHGQPQNDPDFSTEDPDRGQVVTLDGSGQYIIIPNNGAFNTDEITVSAWVNTPGSGANKEIISLGDYDNIAPTNFDLSWVFRIEDHNYLEVFLTEQGNTPPANILTGSTSLSGDWHQVVFSFKEGLLNGYYDGGNVVSNTESFTTIHNAAGDLYIGLLPKYNGNPIGGNYFPGQIDDVMIFDRALSADEIKSLYLLQSP